VPAIVFDRYGFTYAGATKPSLEEISLTIEEGETVLLAGSSGSGKSTLLRSLNGLIPHMYHGKTLGRVNVNGFDVSTTSPTELATKIGFLFQNPENQIFMFSVRRDVAFGPENLGLPQEQIRNRVEEALTLMNITDLADRAPHELSEGQKQRVALAGVLAMKPKILVLDEPLSLLDPKTAVMLVEFLTEIKRRVPLTLLIVEHRLELLANLLDRMVVLHQGRILGDGPLRDVIASDEIRPAGVRIPAIVRLRAMLEKNGLRFDSSPISPGELVVQLGDLDVD
jgi:energy-coupling factor transporter ATP-binding protein EcfA2